MYYSEEDALVYHDLQRSGQQEDMPEEDREGWIDRSARPPINPPRYEEALHSLGRAPIVADLGLHNPGSCSSSLVPYEAGEDSNTKEDQDPQERAPEQIETEEPAMVEAPAKEGMGIAEGPEEYLPASPRYVRDGKDNTDDQDMDEDEDVEEAFLAPKDDPTSRTSQDVQAALLSLEGNTATAKDSQVSSSDKSVPELIDLGKEEDVPPSLLPKKANRPTTLGLDKKMAAPAERPPIPPPHFSKGKAETPPVATPEANIEAEEVPKEQIIYINDNADPSPLSLLERQVDCLLMPPPVNTTPIVQRPPLPPRMDQQPPKVPERRRHPFGAARKKTLQERRKGKPLKLNICTVAKMRTGPAELHCT